MPFLKVRYTVTGMMRIRTMPADPSITLLDAREDAMEEEALDRAKGMIEETLDALPGVDTVLVKVKTERESFGTPWMREG